MIITNKAKFYTFEKEARLYTIVWDATSNYKDINQSGIYLFLDPIELISEIVLSPFVSEWFKPSFEKMISAIKPELSDLITESRVADY